MMSTLAAAASELGSRGNQGVVSSVTNQMKENNGVMPTLVAAASELGSRGNQRAVSSVANQMELETGVMPTAASTAFRLGRYAGGKGVRKPKGNAVWAKVVQLSWSNKEMLGTEQCGNTIGKIAAELCHQCIGLSFGTCRNNTHLGKWYKDARDSEFMRTRTTKDGSSLSSQKSPQTWKKSLKTFTWTSQNSMGRVTRKEDFYEFNDHFYNIIL